MKPVIALTALLVLALGSTATAASLSILFIGNSLLFGTGSAVRFYRSATVTDLNGEGIGGVPALFKSFTQQAGLAYDVSLETRSGSGLDFHLANKLDVIGRRGWDIVVNKAAGPPGVKAVIPVGDAWNRAMQTGVADVNPYDGIEAGKLNL